MEKLDVFPVYFAAKNALREILLPAMPDRPDPALVGVPRRSWKGNSSPTSSGQ